MGNGRDADKVDIKWEETSFWVNGKEDDRFEIRDRKIVVPAGIKSFELRVPTFDDLIIEGPEYLSLLIGDKQASARLDDNDFVKVESIDVVDGAEVDVTMS